MIKTVMPNGNGSHIYVPKEWIGQPLEIITPTGSFTKRPIKYGTGAHIYLPKELEGKQVEISKTDITEEAIERIKPYLTEAKCVCLIGSCARGEQHKNSDIDILIITENTKGIKRQNGGDLIFYPEKVILNPPKDEIIFITNIMLEAKPIINANSFHKLNEKFIKNPKKAHIHLTKTTKDILILWEYFFEQYESTENKENYIQQNKTLFPCLFFAFKEIFGKYAHIKNIKFCTKSMTELFKDVPCFEKYYYKYKKEERDKLWELVSISETKIIYSKCLKMEAELYG